MSTATARTTATTWWSDRSISLSPRANPTQKDSFVPLGGHTACAETFWSRYAPHYLHPHARLCASLAPYSDLADLLPDLDLRAPRDGR